MLRNKIGPLFSQVILSHHSKSHDFFDAHGGFYSVNVFPFFLSDKKFILVNCAHKFLSIYAHLGVSIQRLFFAIFQNAHKNRGMET